ncbi:hypothetical protein [Mesorhizobium sp. M2A.F.Ca.ET.043.05.1.1]|uniref:hypothetical protein n=1 Tax=Mesorhizobium sp. M2A.F.Ca.ET.043.05.1.1 TaxID=2493671 RepID=UPI0016799313|nr:hypothetical protein [Mesorhizobium sp. M2A.F.Ca.ET.043.05.1.1]
MRTKKEEKQNFRVRFLHTTSRKWLVLLNCPSNPSWAQRLPYAPDFQHFSFNISFLGPAECTRICARIRPFSPSFDLSVHAERTRKNGHLYEALIRFLARAGSLQRSLRQRDVLAPRNARRWPTETERQVDRGETPTKSRVARLKTFGELIDLHIGDICDVGKSPRRSKAAALDMLQRHLGKCNIAALDRERLILFGRERAAQGAGPLGIDIGIIEPILSHAAAVHGHETID